MQRRFLSLLIGVLAAWPMGAQAKDKYEVVSEMEFMANKMRLVGQNIALLTYMGDLMDISGREIPSADKQAGTYAVSAMSHRRLVEFKIPVIKENDKTIELFYSLAPGGANQRGTRITLYGKVVKVSDDNVFLLVQREGGPGIEEDWPEDKEDCPTCGRPGYSAARKDAQGRGGKPKKTTK